MQLRRLLIGSAAGLMVAAGAHMGAPGAKAADIFVEPVPEPVDFVRICDVFGRGFFFIPGTDICIKIGGLVRADFIYAHAFDWHQPPVTFTRFVNDVPVGTRTFKFPRSKRNDNEYFTLARQTITIDTRQLTDIGLIRTFGDIWFTIGAGPLVAENVTLTGTVLRQAFIQIAGDTGTATFGRAPSFFDFFGSITFDTVIPGATHPGGVVNLAAWTQNLGNGVSLSLALEDAKTHNRARRVGTGQFGGLVPFPVFWGTGNHGLPETAPTVLQNINLGSPGIHGGSRAPDVVANIRVDQAWGSAQIMGAIHPVRATAAAGIDGFNKGVSAPSTKIGWAAGLGLDLNIPGTGIRFRSQGVYSEGAAGYAVHNPGGPMTDGIVVFPAVGAGSIELTTAWGIHGALTASVAPGWDLGVEAGYRDVDLPPVPGVFTAAQAAFAAPGLFNPVTGTANLDWTSWYVAGQVVWRPVGGFFIGGEVAYEKIDFDAGPSTDRWGGTVRVQRSF